MVLWHPGEKPVFGCFRHDYAWLLGAILPSCVWCVFRVGVCWVTVLSAHSCVPCFMFSQVQVRHRTILLVHIGRSHIATYQEFLVSKLLIFISVNYAIYLC